jgi:hypothetical protein
MQSIRFALAVALAVTPVAANAQEWDEPWSDPRDRPPRVDVSVSAGWMMPTDWSDLVVLGSISSQSGALEQVLVRDLRVEPDVVFGGSVTYWRDRYGFRVQGGFSQSSLTIGGAFDTPDETNAADVNTWLYDVRGAIGLVEYSPTRKAWPYVFLGFGGITYDLDRTITPPLLTFIERGRTQTRTGGIVITDDDGREFLVAIDELGLETVFALNFGVGADFRIPAGGGAIGIRLELSDHVAPTPLDIRFRELGGRGSIVGDDPIDFGRVHHLRAAAGLVIQIGK